MENKILYGARKPDSNRLIGAHSPKVSNSNPNYAVEILETNPNGTQNVKLVKQYPDGNVSNIKKTTLYPEGWSDANIIDATKKVGNEAPQVSRISDRATFHKQTVDGVEIEVIKNGNDVTSSYPTGN